MRAFFQRLYFWFMNQKRKGVTIWHYAIVHPSAEIGENVSIGSYTEIGPNVKIGKNVRIGAHCFIPEGVEIKDNAWIGPCCTFSNDVYPPSRKEDWKRTVIDEGAVLGLGVSVLAGRYVAKGATVGQSSTVIDRLEHKDSIYMGFRAKKHREHTKEELNVCNTNI
jgi:UDP-3-O-[3-hydroxymyristoyl] glucosamine N-acyltransferase